MNEKIKKAIEYWTLPMYEGGPTNLEFLEGVEHKEPPEDWEDPRVTGNSWPHIKALVEFFNEG